MRSRIGTLALAGTLGLGGLGLGLIAAPALATAATTDTTTTEALGDRLGRISDALSGLVTDGTITQEQADAVASTLDEALPQRGWGGPGGPAGPGGWGGRGVAFDVAAEALGVTEDELRSQLRAGESVADVAAAEGVPVEDVVSALVAEARERLAAAVTDGRLTQAEADERAADLEARVTELVQRDDLGRFSPGGHGPRGGDRDQDATDEGTTDEGTTEGSSATFGATVLPA